MTAIQENAIFIADAHYPTHGDTLLTLLYKIESAEIQTPQLFLMGDIFDLLVGGLEKSVLPNREVIALIESIAQRIPVYYFEGNHDFQLAKVFEKPHIFSLDDQPQYMGINGFIIGLSHGDRFAVGWKHHLLSKLLRKSWMISLIKVFKPHIVEQKTSQLQEKEICHEIPQFETKAKKIFECYKGAFTVIEGHYHQGKKIYNYISLPSLACQKQIGVIREGEMVFVDLDKI